MQFDTKHIRYFTKILGKENTLTDKAHLLAYSYDATRAKHYPDIVLFPQNEKQISDIMKYCNEYKIIITPRGGGSGFTGGSLAHKGGVILSVDRHMNKIKEIDLKNMLVVCEPGVINLQLQKIVEAKGLFYPPDPASEAFSTIGGNVCENAGGMRAAKYGITKDYVMALRVVLPNGDIVTTGKKTIKDVAGYNLSGIIIGSEGTLGIVTEITLKLLSKPKKKKTFMAIFDNIDDAMESVYKAMASGVSTVAMEFLDNLTIRCVESKFKKGLPIDAGAIIIGDVDGNVDEEITYSLQMLELIFKQNKAKKFQIAKSEEESQGFWFARKNASPSLNEYGNKKLNEDITVPRAVLPELLKGIDKISKKYGVTTPCFGHVGDGNVHTNVMLRDPDEAMLKIGHKAITEIFELTVKLGGTLSGEHGIGLSKAPFMGLAFSDEEMNLFRAIKKAFDPNNILNPYKMGL
jgi:glycolate oxidase